MKGLPMLDTIALMFCRIAIASVFAASASGKASDITAFRDTVSNFQLLPSSWSRVVALLFLGAELAVVPLMAIGGKLLAAGFILAAGLLAVFSAALVAALWRNIRMTCNCFGRTERRISSYDVVRNMLLILCSLVGFWGLTFGSIRSLSATEILLIGFMTLCFAVLITNLKDVVETLQQPFNPVG